MRLILRCALSIMILMGGLQSYSQISGYAGKRYLLKTDIGAWAWHQEPNVELEYVANRRMTLNANYRMYNRTFDQDYRTQRLNNNGTFQNGMFSTLFPDIQEDILAGGKLTGNELTIRLKIFYKAGSPAPIGLYSELFGGLALMTAKGIANDDGITYPYDLDTEPLLSYLPVKYTMKGLAQYNFGLGMGHQSIHYQRFVLDFGMVFRMRLQNFSRFDDLGFLQYMAMRGDFFYGVFNGPTYFYETIEFIPYLKLGVLLF